MRTKPVKDRIYQVWAHLGRGESLLLRETPYHSVAIMIKDFYLDAVLDIEGNYGIEIRTLEITHPCSPHR